MKKYPFRFLDAYERNDAGVFFGRDEEINALYEMVFQSPVLLVYGASGTGKTSLIQCGLASKFASHDWLPLSVRRGTNINDSFEKALTDAGGSLSLPDNKAEGDKESASAQLLKRLSKAFRSIYLESFKPIYLIFDQFEELFILGSKDERQKFIETIKLVLLTEQPVKMIFSIREEYLGHLSEFEKDIPQLLRKKLRVEPMNRDKVRQVIAGATSYDNSNVSLKEGETEQIADGIFNKIKGEKKSLTIQLPYLQVFLDKFYMQQTGDESRLQEATFTMEALNKIGDIGDILRDFLDEQAIRIGQMLNKDNPALGVEVVWKILSPFATLDGTKEPTSKQNLYERLPELSNSAIDSALHELVNGRILRYDEDVDMYELAHDALAQRIAGKRNDDEIALLEIRRLIKTQTSLKGDARELFTEKQLNLFEPFLEKLNLSAEESALIAESREAVRVYKEHAKRQLEKEKRDLEERQELLIKNQRSQQRFIKWIGAALVVMIGIAIWAFGQKTQADSARLMAETATHNALRQTAFADSAKTDAIRSADIARYQERVADSAGEAAVSSAKTAQEQKVRANLATKEARIAANSAKNALAQTQKIINALEFYDGKYAVASKIINGTQKFGYINKNGDPLIGYKYQYAEAFNRTGFAKVKKLIPRITLRQRRDTVIDFLIDTAGIEYIISYKLEPNPNNNYTTYLDLRGQRLHGFPKDIFSYAKLKILFLNGTIKTIPDSIGLLRHLTILDLTSSQLINVPGTIGQLDSLQTLILDKNHLSVLPNEIGKLIKLRTLALQRNQLQSLPDQMGNLKNLQFLELDKNQLKRLPSDIGKLKNLKRLSLISNELQSLPSEIGGLKNLKSLNLLSNQLESLPPDIVHLKSLQTLILEQNVLRSLPSDIGKLTCLQKLDLDSNSLKSLPPDITNLKNLHYLDLSINHFTSFPEEVIKLTNLDTLGLDTNALKVIPKKIGLLKKLINFQLTSNKLTAIPKEIGLLTNLETLYLNYNQLTSIPKEIGQLKKLIDLDLSFNNLTDLPNEIKSLTNLATLDLSGNPISEASRKRIQKLLPNCSISF